VRQLPEHSFPVRRVLLALLATAALGVASGATADELKPFTAVYDFSWSGMTLAESTVKLERTGSSWTYTSTNKARGLGRIYADRADMVSVLNVTPAGVEPISYKADYGSDKRNVNLAYDWQAHRLTGVYEQTPVDMPLTSAVQDDGSLQIAIMVELLAGRTPSEFSLLNKDKLRVYHYKREGEETVKTPFGDVATIIYSSQADYSPRITRLWCAKDRGYIPVRVEQKKDGSVQWTLQIKTLTRN
jgi:hypothetical protein